MSYILRTISRSWAWWKGVARRIGDVQSRVLLNVFYFLIAMPFAMAVRLTTDPLGIKAKAIHGWRMRIEQDGTPLERAQRQF